MPELSDDTPAYRRQGIQKNYRDFSKSNSSVSSLFNQKALVFLEFLGAIH
jgi:hypothetical protein